MTPELIPGSLGRLNNQHRYKYVKSVINIHSLIQFHFLIVKTIIDATKEARYTEYSIGICVENLEMFLNKTYSTKFASYFVFHWIKLF